MRAVNLGTARIVIIVALVVAGAAVLANGFPESGGSVAGPSGGSSPSGSPSSPTSSPTTTQPSPTGPSPETTGVTFQALNGTDVPGAAGAAQDLLTKDGYVAPGTPADAPSKGVTKTTVYYRAGTGGPQNKSNASYIADTYFHGASVKKLDPSLETVVPPSATIVIVVGQDYAQSLIQ
jgi:LytR cell envelope-related transcriptional attenuator